MAETLEIDEVDQLIASMDSPPMRDAVAPCLVPAQASNTEPQATPSASTARDETDREKPTQSSPPRIASRKSERPSSSGSSSSRRLPLITGNNESPPATTSPRVPSPEVNISPTIDAPCDLDALSELLQTDEASLQRDESKAVTDAIEKSVVFPPLLSPSNKSQSFAPGSPTNKGARRSTMLQKQASLTLSGPLTQSSISFDAFADSQFKTPTHTPRLDRQNMSPSRRRLTIETHEISPHALERLGVNTDILKKEKGMKKLGISDVDIERFEQIRRYSGVPLNTEPVTKVEFMFGFTKEQLLRVKAINRLGTSEEEVQDEYSRQVSRLGIHDVPIEQN